MTGYFLNRHAFLRTYHLPFLFQKSCFTTMHSASTNLHKSMQCLQLNCSRFFHLGERPHTFINLHGGHKIASCYLLVMPVVPEKLCLNICGVVETAAPISTCPTRANVHTCMTQTHLNKTQDKVKSCMVQIITLNI